MNGVHFGRKNLDTTEITFHADTLFSALFQEAIKLEKQEIFLQRVCEGKIILSDAFPYIAKTYYVPKPIISESVKEEKTIEDFKQKKMLKNLKYIPVNTISEFVNGTFPEEYMEDLEYLGVQKMKVSVGIRGMDEPEPYRVSIWYFNEGAGLYILAGYEQKTDLELLNELFDSLQYTGVGGKKSSGLGRFKYKVCEVPDNMKKQLVGKKQKSILLSTALPEDNELETVLRDASYMLIKRSGFIDSSVYAPQQMRKRDLYVFSPGSCFTHTFEGRIIEEKNGGTHPIFRYEKAFFMGV